jgi:hypothetical protein
MALLCDSNSADRQRPAMRTRRVGPAAGAILLACALVGCGHDDGDSRVRNLSGADGDAFFQALHDTGVRDTSGMVGAVHLRSPRVECNAAISPAAIPACTVAFDGRLLESPRPAAATLHRLLVQAGAVVDPGRLEGNSRTVATNAECSRVVYPGVQAECRFEAGG